MKAQRGFSLMELMIGIAIVGILAAVAYPSYTNSVIKANRGNAKAFLLEVAQREQAYLMDKRSYVDSTGCPTGPTGNGACNIPLTPPAEFSRFYTILITKSDGPPPSFTAKADPIAGKRQAADGWLQITETGAKTSEKPDKW